ncbi:MAG: OmpA family protein, partial [Rhodobacterales bacterium]|nr:OmpA family protein [Rhodobacterales bacterium]
MTFAKFPLALAAISALALTACEAPLPGQTNDNARQGALVGAGLGAVLGAVTGNNSDERLRNAAIGGALGAGLGAIGGSNLDRQEAELRQQLGANVGIVNNGQNLTVTLPQDILFAVDSASLTSALQGDLRSVAASLNRYPETTVNVIGHTDNTGAAAYNQDLSQRRAQAVSSVLVNAGVAPVRVRAIGRGEDQPIASNLTPEGRQQNRRV